MGYASTAPALTYGATDNVLQEDATQYTDDTGGYVLVKTFYQIGQMGTDSYLRFKCETNGEIGNATGFIEARYYDGASETVLFTMPAVVGGWVAREEDFTANWTLNGEIRIYINSDNVGLDSYIRNSELCGELSPFIQ